MDQTPGQLVGDMVWLVARYPREPGVLMKMGSILTDPTDLESSLNLDGIEAPPRFMDASLGVRSSVKTSLSHDNSALVKAAATVPVLAGVAAGAGVEGRWKHDVATTVHAMDVRACEFIPDADYMARALLHPKVVAHTKACFFFDRLYIIVGVATARELRIKETMTQQRTLNASASAEVTGVAEGTAGAKRDTTASASQELEVGKECDFAYRVRQFVYYKTRVLRNKGNFTEKAMFGENQADANEDTPDYVPAFQDLKPSDAAPAGIVGLVAEA